MILFRLADLPRATWRLSRPAPLLPPGDEQGAGMAAWGLRPALLDPADAATLQRVEHVLAAYRGAVGSTRNELAGLAHGLEEVVGDYRLARCLARCVEADYTFATPTPALEMGPVAARALVYQRAQGRHSGFVPSRRRQEFLAELAAELGCAPAELEATLTADAPGEAALLPTSQETTPEAVARRYNAAAVGTALAAASFIVLHMDAGDTGLLKELYRRAKGLRVGVDPRLIEHGSGAGATIEVTLYGPGSRALVRLREVGGGYDADDGADEEEGQATLLPAPGGPAFALLLGNLARLSPRLTGWARLLGPDRRAYHYPLDRAALTALRGEGGAAPGEPWQAAAYDSAVEADFAAAFLAQQAGGRMGVTRGWEVVREPRPVIVGATVFLPDFGFRRGGVEVLCEIVGYYTEDYLARKARKLAALRGRITLLLVVDQALAEHLAGSGYPTITYKAGQTIRVTEVVAALDREFDPLEARRTAGLAALRALCAADGPAIDEQELCARTGCAGRTELAALWSDLTAQGAVEGGRRYVHGQGLACAAAVDQAGATLRRRLTEAGGCLALDDALALCREAGLPGADEGLLGTLGVRIRRDSLFGVATVCLPGASPETPSEAPTPPRRRRR